MRFSTKCFLSFAVTAALVGCKTASSSNVKDDSEPTAGDTAEAGQSNVGNRGSAADIAGLNGHVFVCDGMNVGVAAGTLTQRYGRNSQLQTCTKNTSIHTAGYTAFSHCSNGDPADFLVPTGMITETNGRWNMSGSIRVRSHMEDGNYTVPCIGLKAGQSPTDVQHGTCGVPSGTYTLTCAIDQTSGTATYYGMDNITVSISGKDMQLTNNGTAPTDGSSFIPSDTASWWAYKNSAAAFQGECRYASSGSSNNANGLTYLFDPSLFTGAGSGSLFIYDGGGEREEDGWFKCTSSH